MMHIQIQSDLHMYVWNYITYDCPAILITEGYIWITTFCSVMIYASRIYVVQGRFEIKLPSTLWYKTHQIPNFKSLLSRLAVFFVHSIEARYWIENEDGVGAAPTGDAPTTSEWSTIFLPNRVRHVLEVLRYASCSKCWKRNICVKCFQIPLAYEMHLGGIDVEAPAASLFQALRWRDLTSIRPIGYWKGPQMPTSLVWLRHRWLA